MKKIKEKDLRKGYNPRKIERPSKPSEVEPGRIYSIINFCKGVDFKNIIPDWFSGKRGPEVSNPEYLLGVWIYGYGNKITSGRKLSREIGRNIDLQYLSDGFLFSFTVLNKFRRELKDSNKELLDTLKRWNGEPEGNLSLDGTQISCSGSHYQFRRTKDLERLKNKHKEKEKLGDKKSSKRVLEYEKAIEYIEDYPNVSTVNLRELDSRVITHGRKTTYGYNVLTICDERRKIYGIAPYSNNREAEAFSRFYETFEHRIKNNNEYIIMDSDYFTQEIIEYLNAKGRKALINTREDSKKIKMKQESRYIKDDFKYNKEKDVFICPCGKELTNRGVKSKERCNGFTDKRYNYLSSRGDCKRCEMKSKCLSNKSPIRCITISLSEELVEKQKNLLLANKKLMNIRWKTIELVFGIIKGSITNVMNRFILKGIDKVSVECVLLAIAKDVYRDCCRLFFCVIFIYIKKWNKK